ncbi:MAG TPA: hypothetical protein VJ842_13365 [Pyrinomonadaceae bacterium]|nr:hypothetical protein [Pyrinomonadaceae bacterium]
MSTDDKKTDGGSSGESNLMGNDAGTKGTGSAGLQADESPDTGTESANTEGGDAGTKGTGSAG